MEDEARRPRDVVVLGAGLAGLAAAWELAEAGHEVTVLEARSRPGGRVETLREPFAGDLHVEAGAIFFGVGYTEADRYIDELGLERTPVAAPDLRQLYHLRGRRFAVAESGRPEWPYELSPDEQGLDPEEIVERYVAGTLPPEVSRPASWREAPLTELDELTIAQYMREQGASEGALHLLRHTRWWGAGMEASSALSSALADVELWGGEPPYVLSDGNDRLPVAMADRLGDRVRYGVEVIGLRDDGEGVEVRARLGSGHRSLRADRAICTLPATVLRDVSFEPDLPAEKRAAVHDLPYLDTTRIFLQVDRCFWYDEGVTGSAWTDLPIGEVARQPASDPGGPGERAVLECHVRGPSARPLAGRPDADVLDDALRHLEEVHPGVRDHRQRGVVRAWSEDPWARSAYSWPAPGDVSRHLEPLQRPHGRIHFAGEHTSVLRGTMEGALRSGIRAAEEVDGALGGS